MCKINSGLFEGTVGALSDNALKGKTTKEPTKTINCINPKDIRYSQASVSGSQDVISSMRNSGWRGHPIDVVVMDDGKLTTLDNTRVVAARVVGIDVFCDVHGYDEPLPNQATKDRFTTPKGGVPQTWGQAVENRIGKQPSGFRRDNPRGSYNMQKTN